MKHVLLWKHEVGPPSVKMLISAEGEGLVLPKYEEHGDPTLRLLEPLFLPDGVLV